MSILTVDDYCEVKNDLKIIFLFKLDEEGEIHSAHIRYSKNYNGNRNRDYEILSMIEETLKAEFLFERCNTGGKYSYCTIPITFPPND